MGNIKLEIASRREREWYRHRREILSAAEELLVEKGFEKTTMQDIAARAEFAVGTIYRFFKNKKVLFEELFLESWRDIETKLNQALDQPGDELARLQAYHRTCVMLIVENETMARIFYGQMANFSIDPYVGIVGEFREIMKRLLGRLEALFRSGIEKGRFVDLDARVLAIGFDTLVGAYLAVLLGEEKPMDVNAWIKTINRMFFNGIMVHSSNEP